MTKTAEEISESVARIPQEFVASQPSVLVAGGVVRGAHPVSLWASLKGRYLLPVYAVAGYSRCNKVQGLTWNKLATLDFNAAWLA